ncbi:MAG: hypothetical protein EPN93_17340 [Spirochaetes bacterium]|nr:MAG: hypothetical protein EPN93_17340 [Spirochaetota bacterium]
MTALSLLYHMLTGADRVSPWKAEELAQKAGVPLSTAYRNLRYLTRKKIVTRVNGGYMLSRLVLETGARYQSAFARLEITKEQEKIYGAAK